jgi:DNA-binding NarL/FixJ family response regulator
MKILVADDHALLRTGLLRILREDLPQAEFGESGTTQETLDRLAECRWDLLVLDVFMPGRSGLEVLSEVRRSHPDLPVLVLSSAPEQQLAIRVLKAGAKGFLNKQSAPEQLTHAVKKLLDGGMYLSARLAEALAAGLAQSKQTAHERLSDREFQVMKAIVAGKTLKEIASDLALSAKTISTFHTRIWEKLGVRNDVELVLYAIEHRLVDYAPSPPPA